MGNIRFGDDATDEHIRRALDQESSAAERDETPQKEPTSKKPLQVSVTVTVPTTYKMNLAERREEKAEQKAKIKVSVRIRISAPKPDPKVPLD